MGYYNAGLAFENWSHLPPNAHRVLIRMALESRDTDTQPRYFGGREILAQALGYDLTEDARNNDLEPLRDAAYKTVQRCLKVLSDAAVIERSSDGHRGKKSEYVLCLGESPSGRFALDRSGSDDVQRVKEFSPFEPERVKTGSSFDDEKGVLEVSPFDRERGTPSDPQRVEKGYTTRPPYEKKGDTHGTPKLEKGGQSEPERGTIQAERGTPSDPPITIKNNKENELLNAPVQPQASSDASNTVAFEKFWNTYPRKISKGRARTAFTAALKKTDTETLLQAATAYKTKTTAERTEERWILHPANWLDQERWTDQTTKPAPITNTSWERQGWQPGQPPPHIPDDQYLEWEKQEWANFKHLCDEEDQRRTRHSEPWMAGPRRPNEAESQTLINDPYQRKKWVAIYGKQSLDHIPQLNPTHQEH